MTNVCKKSLTQLNHYYILPIFVINNKVDMIKKRILIITSVFPYPLNSGGAQAQFHMIDALRKQIDLSIAYISNNVADEEELQKLWPDVEFFPYFRVRKNWFRRKYRKSIIRKYERFFQNKRLLDPGLKFSFEGLIDYAFVNHLEEVVKAHTFDAIQMEFSPTLFLAFALPEMKHIFVQHEISFIRNLRYMRGLENRSASDIYQYNMLKQQEIGSMNQCTSVVVLTDIDKNILLNEGVRVPIYVSPAIIPSPKALPQEYQFENRLIFIGGDDHHPNYEGITWFLENVWHKVLTERPDTELHIIGKWHSHHKREIETNYKQVKLTGFVPSLEPYTKTSIMIVPILTGSGMRMKIVDAANYGIPFITTTVGVEGLSFVNAEDCYIEDDPQQFANATIALMDNRNEQLLFRENAYQKMQQAYDNSKMLGKRMDVYKHL